MQQHIRDVLSLQQILQNQAKTATGPHCLAGATTASNTTRNRAYKKSCAHLDISHLKRIVEVDVKRQTAFVEPRISMYELSCSLLKYNLMPKVVPEFKGITVGGAINGCAGESNSHLDGLFHDTCLEYEVLLSTGERVVCSRDNSSDLFHALHGSYGSLGLVVGAKIALVPAMPFMRLCYHRFDSIPAALAYLQSRMSACHSIEGIIYGPDDACIVEAKPVVAPLKSMYHVSQRSSQWFYHHARGCLNGHEETVPLLDYIFRHDKGAFWMGAYVLRPKILYALFMEGVLGWKDSPISLQSCAKLKDPGFLTRFVSAHVMQSQPLYRLLHLVEDWVKERFVIQDFTLPQQGAYALLDHLVSSNPLFPLWVCPVKRAPQEQLFCPAALDCTDDICFNVGVYGMPHQKTCMTSLLCDLEQKVQEFGGRKWLYTNSEYSRLKFWDIYPEQAYQQVREKYSAEHFMRIDDKVLKAIV